MQITLYKNCKLNNAYKNVFSFRKTPSNTNLLADYLSSLTSITIDLGEYVYASRTGTIPVLLENPADLEIVEPYYSNIYEFNYCRIQDQDNDILRYCFITDIEFKNETALISYEEDIWHSYGANMNITESFLAKNRLADKNNFYTNGIKTLPLKYTSVKEPTVTKYNTTNTTYNVVAELQVYKAKADGKIGGRRTYVTLVHSLDSATPPTITKDFTLDKAQVVCQDIVSLQADDCAYWKNGTDKYNFNVVNLYILPKYYNIETLFKSMPEDMTTYFSSETGVALLSIGTYSDDLIGGHHYCCNYVKSDKIDIFNSLITSGSKTINADKKMQSIGTFTTQIPVLYNGENIKFDLKAYISVDSFKLYFYSFDSLVEITEDFKYEVPFTSATSEENSMLQLNRNIRNITSVASIVGGAVGLGLGIGNVGNYGSLIASATTPTGRIRKSGGEPVITPQGLNNLRRGERASIEGVVGASIGISGGIADLVKNNASLYSSTQMNKTNSFAVLNAYYGICWVTTDSTNNFDNYITGCIDNTGFTVFEWVKNFNITGIKHSSNTAITTTMRDTYKYNYVKFDIVNTYGNFPRSVANILEEILLNGTKVWFTTAIE